MYLHNRWLCTFSSSSGICKELVSNFVSFAFYMYSTKYCKITQIIYIIYRVVLTSHCFMWFSRQWKTSVLTDMSVSKVWGVKPLNWSLQPNNPVLLALPSKLLMHCFATSAWTQTTIIIVSSRALSSTSFTWEPGHIIPHYHRQRNGTFYSVISTIIIIYWLVVIVIV